MSLPFEFEDLSVIITISEMKGLRRAAALLNIEQSALSRRVRKLENRLGLQLFERGNGGTHPTIAGLELIAAARRIIADADAVHIRLKAHEKRRHPKLTIGVQVSPTGGTMATLLAEYLRRSPDVDIRIKDGDRSSLLDLVRDRHLDIAIVATGTGDWPDASLALWCERVVAGLSADHPLATHDVIVPRDLVGELLLLPEQGPGLELAHLLGKISADETGLRISVQAAALDRFLCLVRSGYGTVIMLEGGTGLHCEGVVYREINDNGHPVRVEVMACWSHANRNAALRGFVDLLKSHYPELRGRGGIAFPS